MADSTTKLTIELQLILKNLNRTLRGLDQVKKRLDSITGSRGQRLSTVALDRQALATQRLAVQAQELANRQERVRQQTERLALSNQRLTQAQQRVARTAGQQADAHVRAFRALQRSIAQTPKLDAHVRAFQAMQRALSQAPQMDAHVRAFRALERATAKAPQLDAHVKAFRALQAAAAQAPQMDAHVRAFRRLQEEAQRFNQSLTVLGNSLRSVGQGLASFGATLSIAVSAPLAALGAGIVDAAVRMDSLQRGLTTIAGSSELATIQLERLTEIAKLPGIGFEEAIQGSIALQAVGFSAQEAEKALIQFSNAVALTGGSREQLQTITVQLGQMAAQSKVLAADLKPIINAAPAVAVALRNAFGTVRSEEIQELGIQSKDFIDIMIKELGKLPRATAGARNSFDNFRDSVFRAAAVIGGSLLPALVRLTETLEPIITGLARTFAALPAPIQSTVFVLTALAIALGPFTFIFGQLVTGLGRVIVGFAQLNAAGLLPTIANFRLLGQVMVGTASLAQGAAATAALAAVGWATLAGVVVAAIGVIAAIATLSTRTKEHVETTEEQVRATEASLKVLRAQQGVLGKVTSETEAAANASDELRTIYKSLNKESQGRVEVMNRELGLTKALRSEIARLIVVREGEQRIQAATVAGAITETASQIQTLGQRIDSTIDRVERLKTAREELARTGRLPRGVADPLLSSIASLDSVKQLERIDETIQRLSSEQLPELRKQSDDATASLAKQSDQLLQLESATGRSTREILEQAKAYGLFKGDVETAALGIEAFRKAQISLEAALSGTTEEVIRQRLELRKLSGPADEAQKQRRILIDAAIDFARENSNTIDEAKKKLDEFADKFPEVRKAIEDEVKKRPIEEFLREFTGRKGPGRGDTGVSLRNARQQLADAITQVALAQKEQEVQIELDKNEALQRAMDTGQKLRLFSYREYLEARANLTAESLDKEIGQQLQIVTAAKLAQARLLKEARRAGIGEAERTRRRAQAAQAEEEAVRAETRLLVLRQQRDRVTAELTQQLKEAQDQQLRDTIQLEIAFAELEGKIEDAMNVAAVEEFREQLEDLTKAQDFLNKQIEKSKKLRQAERVEALQQEQQRNQRQIETIQNTIKVREALAQLAAAERLVENAKERQRSLEADLAFQVQNRGLSEEESIRRRLEGEQRVQASMELSKSIVEGLQQELIRLSIIPPPQLQEFINNLKREMLGLGELTFVEQFRLAEKEFQRLNDQRIQRINDIERAVQNRTISEAEGLLFIRKINGDYVGDLEQQLQLLKEIAAASGDANLQRQAQSAEETVKDANDRLADFNKQLRSTSIDAVREGFVGLLQDLASGTDDAKEALLSLLDTVAGRLLEIAAENLFDKFIESLFGDGTFDPIGAIKRLFGIGGGGGNVVDLGAEAVSHGAEAAEHGARVAAATAAATAFTTGVTAASAGFGTSVVATATSFASLVISAGVAFAAAITGAAAAESAIGGIGAAAGGGAATGLFPAIPGGVYRVVEGGYPEAVLTTDPKHATRQLAILKAYLNETRGLGGRIKSFAAGAMISPTTAMMSGMSHPSLPSSDIGSMVVASAPSEMRLRQVLVSENQLPNWINSSEGERVMVDWLYKNQSTIRKIGGR